MPKINNVGYGEATPIKLQAFDHIIKMHLAVAQAVQDKHPNRYPFPYRYLELTAGLGFTPDGQRGSTLVFLDRIHSGNYHLSYQADFIDSKKENLDTLVQTVQAEAKKNQWGTTFVRYQTSDYQAAIPLLFPTVNASELGLVFVDHSGELPDWDSLKMIAARRPKMEILIYISSTAVKRIYQYTGQRLSDYMAMIGKKFWLIRKPEAWDKFKWTFLLGANSDIFKAYKKINFYRDDSPQGLASFQELNLTEEERINAIQPRLEGL